MEQSVAMTPAEILAIVRRRQKSLILPAVTIIVLAGLVALLLPPIYRSTATILIEQQEIPTDFVKTTVTSFAEQRLQQINQRIMSFTRLLEIIQRFGLYPELVDKKTTEEIVEQMRNDTERKRSAPIGCGFKKSPHRGDKALPPEGAGPGVAPPL